MNRIIDKINSHKFLNNDDVITIINERLKELNLDNENINVCFINEVDYMSYTHEDKSININPKYRSMILKSIIEDKLIVAKKKSGSTFLTDFYNLSLLWHLFHELRHVEQLNIMFKEYKKYNNLLKLSDEFIENNYGFYLRKHSLSLLEYDAEMNSLSKIFSLLENLQLSDSSIYYLNIIVACSILKSRGYNEFSNELKRDNIFHSPFEFLRFLTNVYYGLGNVYDDVIYNIMDLRNEYKTEYDKLIIGDRLSDDTIEKIFLIAQGKIRTKNIFDYVKDECKTNIKILKKEIR